MKKLLKKMFTNFVMSEKSQTTPLIRHFVSPSPTIGEKEILCAKHTVTNLSTYRLNVLKTDNTPTLSRICKFAYSSLTNSTLSQRERVKYGFTLAEVFSPCRKVKLNFGFTLAEVLITLGIIGIVAALVIPNIVTKYQKHVTVSHLKKAYSIVSQALVSSQAENGDMVEWGLDNAGDFMAGGINNSAAASAAITNTYVNKYFVPYLNVADNCGLKCNRQKNIKRYRLNGQQWLWYDIYYVVYLKDGMIIAFLFDNVNGLMNTIHTYVDINGDQKPNISGRDIFTFNFNSSTNKVNFAGSEFNRSQLLADWRSCCNKNAGDYSGDYCGALIQLDGWKIKEDYPW